VSALAFLLYRTVAIQNILVVLIKSILGILGPILYFDEKNKILYSDDFFCHNFE
jgi:hypothetical protein